MDYCELHIANNYTDIMGSGWDWNQTRAIYMKGVTQKEAELCELSAHKCYHFP